MREIKFRAWDDLNKTMVLAFHPRLKIDGYTTEVLQDYTVMQYTGSKDKNNKEIYEGDVLQGPSDSRVIMGQSSKSNKRVTARFEVKWWTSDNGGSFGLKRLSQMERTYPHFTESEVIGNIYENPELLTKDHV